jgi:hypothetical protein
MQKVTVLDNTLLRKASDRSGQLGKIGQSFRVSLSSFHTIYISCLRSIRCSVTVLHCLITCCLLFSWPLRIGKSYLDCPILICFMHLIARCFDQSLEALAGLFMSFYAPHALTSSSTSQYAGSRWRSTLPLHFFLTH